MQKTYIMMTKEMKREYQVKVGMLNNHPANIKQDHLTITAFFETEVEFLTHIEKLEKYAQQWDNKKGRK